MESDSDHFESADEEFLSDDDDNLKNISPKNVIANPNVTSKILPEKNLSVQDSKEDIKLHEEESNKTSKNDDNEQLEIKQDSNVTNTVSNILESNTNPEKPKPRVIERRERPQKTREPKSKVKLGVKLSNENKSEAFWKAYTEAKKNEYGIPPQRVVCWEEGVNWPPPGHTPEKNRDSETASSSNLYSEKSSNFNPGKNFWENEEDYMELPRDDKKNEESNQSKKEIKDEVGWGSWGNWGGMSSFLSTAQLSVSTISNLTSTVSQGVTKVLETGIGIPDPEELAKLDKEQETTEKEENSQLPDETDVKTDDHNTPQEQQKSSIGFGLGNLVSGVTQITKLVETTGSKVLTGGLDTLEVIGKKTMEVLQEGDPGLKKKRALFKIDQDKPVLSQILREAKEKAEEEDKMNEGMHIALKPHYETMFDDYQGLVHLEALEMLSKQCDIKLETLIENMRGTALQDMQETMAQIKELCELPDEEEDNSLNDMDIIGEKIETAISEMNINITYKYFLETWGNIDSWLQESVENEDEIHQKAIESLAELTAIAVEQFHKAGELLLVKERRSTVDEADSLVQLTITLTGVIGAIAGKFSEKLNTFANGTNSDHVNTLITNIFLEAANSSSYIQDAFNLMIPVLQVGAV